MTLKSKKSSRPLSKTPRKHSKKRALDFGLDIRKKISENWVEVRKGNK